MSQQESPERIAMRERNRRLFPELAKWVDEIRVHFPEAKVVSINNLSPSEWFKREAEREAQATREQDG